MRRSLLAMLLLIALPMLAQAAGQVSGTNTPTSVWTYVVQQGDTMHTIAAKKKCSLGKLMEANRHVKDPNGLKPGEKITLPPPDSMENFEKQVLALTNKERERNGLKPLSGSDATLNRCAHVKAADMRDANYFSHTSPTYGSPFDMLRQFGVQYRQAAENIAAGQQTAEEVVKSWMQSSGHRANILNASYTHIGIGYAKGGSQNCYWAQQFISK
ncbi:CAP domain-containing protein [Priestia taiwanensis]|uniref:LysM domain-containing protein n=1 Tax=Priestia taiwanensis TaxID=1347902 RepID=A0A917AQJ5_9BACI|nr:CAP domain-containing protein [Priestia taiwanensis]MBM7363068.1 putative YkwD family protein [Priestia taiwanensis]GGE67414.1 hypothetical protein GCM10007140_16890 [Priestia taiwanensis]